MASENRLSYDSDDVAADYAINGKLTGDAYDQAHAKLKSYANCVITEDFWKAYEIYGYSSTHGTANGIYQLCLINTAIPVSCIEDNFFDLALDFTYLARYITVLPAIFDISGYGVDAQSVVYLGSAPSHVVKTKGHSNFYYTDSSINCQDDHFKGCRLTQGLSELCISELGL